MLSTIDAYINLIFTLFALAVFTVMDINGSYFPAIITLYLGFFQLISAGIRTFYQLVNAHPLRRYLIYYWVFVAVYLGWLFTMPEDIEGKLILTPGYLAAVYYSGLTWKMQKISHEAYDQTSSKGF